MHTDTVEDVLSWLRSGGRVILLVRHAERTKIDPKDPTFGDSLPITEEGARSAKVLGSMFAEFASSATFVSSPLMRTRMTAAAIAEGMGLAGWKTRQRIVFLCRQRQSSGGVYAARKLFPRLFRVYARRPS